MPTDVTLWDSQTLTSPYADNIVATSSEISNDTQKKAGLVTIRMEAEDPDGDYVGVGFLLRAYLEEKVANAGDPVWIVRAASAKWNQPSKGQQVIELAPRRVDNPGVAEDLELGSVDQLTMRREGVLPETLRVRIALEVVDESKAQLSSVTLSGWLRMYDI